jgi:HEPN domain-containing protein
MADTRIVKEWLTKADYDLAFADVTLREGNTFYAQLCFHFQQSAEKYLKALIIANGMEFEKVHNLEDAG